MNERSVDGPGTRERPTPNGSTRPGPIGFRISAGTPAPDFATIDAAWAAAAETGAFDAVWMSDHLSDTTRERGGPGLEPVATAAAIAHRVPGLWIGIAVFANTFRHPALLAKSAAVLDVVTGGRFVLGLGAGWHEGEHSAFGIELGPPARRVDRLESALRVLDALFSSEARTPAGVSLDDPHYPLKGATMDPAPRRPTGPPRWVGGQGPRGVRLVARHADGWPMPGNRPGDVPYFGQKRDEIRRALEAVGRDPDDFTFAAQVETRPGDAEMRQALDLARSFVRAGADHVILAVPAWSDRDAVRRMADDLARRLRDDMAAAG
jgi:alkanesulfonate monooxygenase SsuD/methylene tetrahydromethanopterin reductase-like flavin-dependent oxidoreductase (luciferase family)